jgi:hypothetical protein
MKIEICHPKIRKHVPPHEPRAATHDCEVANGFSARSDLLRVISESQILDHLLA